LLISYATSGDARISFPARALFRFSVKAVLMNPFTVTFWGLIVAGSLAIGFLLVFAGLAVVVPVFPRSSASPLAS